MNLIDVHRQFHTEDECLEYLAQQRWPNGVRCVKCNSERVAKYQSHGKTGKPRTVYNCLDCLYQFTAKAGTLFHDSHVPLQKWFLAVELIAQSKKGMSAKQLERALGVTYKTAWYMAHRIRESMQEHENLRLTGTVEVDETYVGGRAKHCGSGRGMPNKAVVIGLRQRRGPLRFVQAKDARSNTLYKIIHDHVSERCTAIMTDDFAAYDFAMGSLKPKHHRINHKYQWVEGIVHTNTIESAFSLLKRGIVGTFHRLSHKHLWRYLNEFSYRFNRREKEPELFGLMLRGMTHRARMPYGKLIE